MVEVIGILLVEVHNLLQGAKVGYQNRQEVNLQDIQDLRVEALQANEYKR